MKAKGEHTEFLSDVETDQNDEDEQQTENDGSGSDDSEIIFSSQESKATQENNNAKLAHENKTEEGEWLGDHSSDESGQNATGPKEN